VAVTWISSFRISRVRCDSAVFTVIPDSSAVAFEQTAAAQSVSGTIAWVEKTSFTLTVGAGHATTNLGHQFQDSPPNSKTFQIDKNATIDGKLKVGATAELA
jgi:hypothetical protein